MPELLNNPGFEGNFRIWNGVEQINLSEGWLPFWVAQQSSDAQWKNRRPIYRPVAVATAPARVRSGQAAQMYYTSWATHTAGMMQKVNVTPGQRLRLSAYGHAWSTDQDSTTSTDPGDVRLKIGIDPTGSLNPFSASVVWSVEKAVYDSYDDGFVVEALAAGAVVSVFVMSSVQSPKKHNDIFWDDISLQEVSAAGEPITQGLLLSLESQTRQVNQPVQVKVTYAYPVTNVHLNVSGPTGGVEVTPQGIQSGVGQGYMWSWSFTPQVEGPYTATFSADGIEAKSSKISISSTATTPSPSTPTSPSTRGRPRSQYSRTYILLPADAGKDWLQAVVDSGVLTQYRWTVGFSADDAGIGDLDDRTVIIINPSAWPDPIEAWFGLWYPGVKVHPVNASSPETLRVILQSLS